MTDNIFCTLFDSNYLDKGLVLYDSMCKHIDDFRLYVFAFDEKAYEILKAENKKNLIPIRSSDMENVYPCLKEAKDNRNSVEYNWTCSSWTIKYVLEQYNERICTYIDADMKFFSSPSTVFETMRNRGDSVIIVPHRFHSDKFEKIEGPKTGFYCVEFNTFLNDSNGKLALDWWAEQCCKWCYYIVPSVDQWYGDQKYLNEFPKKFKGIYICDDYGVGLGPWNDNRMDLYADDPAVKLVDKQTKAIYTLIIYHYAGVRFLSDHLIKVSSRMQSKKLHKAVFDPYISEIMDKRRYIKKSYGLELTKAKPILTSNPILKAYQQYIMPIVRLRHFYNLYRIDD